MARINASAVSSVIRLAAWDGAAAAAAAAAAVAAVDVDSGGGGSSLEPSPGNAWREDMMDANGCSAAEEYGLWL